MDEREDPRPRQLAIDEGSREGGGLQPELCEQRRLRSELYIDTGNAEENLALLAKLEANKDAIEDAFGGPLTWEPVGSRFTEKATCSASTTTTSTWTGSLTRARGCESQWSTSCEAVRNVRDRVKDLEVVRT